MAINLILLGFLLALLIKFLSLCIRHNISGYANASGKGFFKTVFNKGYSGEFLIFMILKHFSGHKKILTNLYIPKNDGTTTEIDLVLINQSGIFVIESKNYSGKIYGDEKDKMWEQRFKARIGYKFFNPIWQNKGHISALKGVLQKADRNLVHSYIVFGKRCEFRRLIITSPGIMVVKTDTLFPALKKDMREKGFVLSDRNIDKIFNSLKVYAHATKETKERHVFDIINKNSASAK